MLWDDTGRISQGKILTAILQGRLADAREMLHGWSDGDLVTLDSAAQKLSFCVRKELARR